MLSTELPPAVIIGSIITIVLLLVMSFFFSGCETAVTSIKQYQWESHQTKEHSKVVNKIVDRMLGSYSITLGAVLIGNTIANIVSPALVTMIVTNEFGSMFVGISTGILTFFVLIACEYFPKAIARKNAIKWLKIFAFPLYFFWIIFWPFCVVFNLIFERKKNITASERDLSFLIKTVQKEGILEQGEADLVKKAMLFDEITIGKIMVKNVVHIESNENVANIIDKFVSTNYSRLPVVDSKTKKVIGFILSKEMLRAFINSQSVETKFEIKNFIKKIHSVTTNTKLDVALRIIQRNNTHILAVVDSLTSKKMIGIVTMEMLLEQIVGQIYDEKDAIKNIQIINDFTWVVKANVNAYDFFKKHFGNKIKNKKITIDKWVMKTFAVKKVQMDQFYENDSIKVLVLSTSNNNDLSFEITKK